MQANHLASPILLLHTWKAGLSPATSPSFLMRMLSKDLVFGQGLRNEQMGKMVGSLRPDWLWFQLRHHGSSLPKGNVPLFWACSFLSPGPSSFPPYPSSPFFLHRQAGQVWGHKPAGPEHLVAAAAPALPAPSAGHGFHLPVTGWAHRGHRKPPGPVQRAYF